MLATAKDAARDLIERLPDEASWGTFTTGSTSGRGSKLAWPMSPPVASRRTKRSGRGYWIA